MLIASKTTRASWFDSALRKTPSRTFRRKPAKQADRAKWAGSMTARSISRSPGSAHEPRRVWASRRYSRGSREVRCCQLCFAETLEARLLLSAGVQWNAAFADIPAAFIPNQGQWDPAIRYAAQGTGADILLTD